MARVFVLADIPEHRGILLARHVDDETEAAWDYAAAVGILSRGPHDIAYWDYELGRGHPMARSGADVARFVLAAVPPERWPRLVVVHSHNRSGAREIARLFFAAGVRVQLRPFEATP